jgi:hypothetical protein
VYDLDKVCIKCNAKKTIEEYPKYKDRNGNHSYRNVCKACLNKQQSTKYRGDNKNKVNNTNKIIEPEKKAIIKDREEKDVFNDDEIKVLKSIIEDYPEFKKLLNNKIELEKDDNEKIKRSISMSKQVDVKISNLVKNGTLNYSEVVNSLLKKALEFV